MLCSAAYNLLAMFHHGSYRVLLLDKLLFLGYKVMRQLGAPLRVGLQGALLSGGTEHPRFFKCEVSLRAERQSGDRAAVLWAQRVTVLTCKRSDLIT